MRAFMGIAADVSDVDCILNCDSESVSISANNLEAYLHLPIVNSKLGKFSLLRNFLSAFNFAKINLRRERKLLVCCNNDKKCNRASCSSYCRGFRCLNTYIGHPRPCEVDLLQLQLQLL
ncbi:uncharacterized protein LOC114285167 isoform X3 [Camellia sinensis]|uniref:uncharacterized protein LOC114285167 isoform X3 n=1 Tax=Camellia sinensis TaxID=4442 RepID=UPI001036724A|nr:uncharacterized protein LOC114285167 isoform X3 [Camellia sinensis]